jgi:hypothetical protein
VAASSFATCIIHLFWYSRLRGFHTSELVKALSRVEDEHVSFGAVVGLHLIEVDAKVEGVAELVEEAREVDNTMASPASHGPVDDSFLLSYIYKGHASCKLT